VWASVVSGLVWHLGWCGVWCGVWASVASGLAWCLGWCGVWCGVWASVASGLLWRLGWCLRAGVSGLVVIGGSGHLGQCGLWASVASLTGVNVPKSICCIVALVMESRVLISGCVSSWSTDV
jgi:hypothetical protein